MTWIFSTLRAFSSDRHHARLWRAVYCAALLWLALTAVACSKEHGDEELIRRAVAEASAFAEAKDISGVIRHLSKDYRDDKGLDYRGIKGLLFGELVKPGSVKVFVTAVSVELKPPRAIAEVRAVLVRGKDAKSLKDILPEDADAFKFTLLFKKDEGGWKVFESSWERVSVAGLL